ncbi:hypothetical protein AABM17_804 [Neisseria musculi]|uniref:Uncharacterized protein n=1 Tax=Neisseria musculi TaxID=1815583 RepID=A0A7H1M8J7_9NEIS|nr:hypothetical protein H7A79_0804 [Neisseria musculi]
MGLPEVCNISMVGAMPSIAWYDLTECRSITFYLHLKETLGFSSATDRMICIKHYLYKALLEMLRKDPLK